MQQAEEAEAITWLKQGNIGGLEILVRKYQQQAIATAGLITCDWALAEDVVQAAFIKVYEQIEQFDQTRPFRPWFLRIVVNDATRAATRSGRSLSLENEQSEIISLLPDAAPSPEELIERAETRQQIWQALARLTPKQRGAIVLRYYLELTEAEVATQLNCPPGTAKRRLHDARQRLKQLLTSK